MRAHVTYIIIILLILCLATSIIYRQGEIVSSERAHKREEVRLLTEKADSLAKQVEALNDHNDRLKKSAEMLNEENRKIRVKNEQRIKNIADADADEQLRLFTASVKGY